MKVNFDFNRLYFTYSKNQDGSVTLKKIKIVRIAADKVYTDKEEIPIGKVYDDLNLALQALGKALVEELPSNLLGAPVQPVYDSRFDGGCIENDEKYYPQQQPRLGLDYIKVNDGRD